MSDDLNNRLKAFRSLRDKAQSLANAFDEDHEAFLHKGLDNCFFRLPSKPRDATKTASDKDLQVNVTPTCTGWMALCSARKQIKNIKQSLEKVLSASWDTGGLAENNPFTVAVVARSIGFLVEYKHIALSDLDNVKRSSASWETTASDLVKNEVSDKNFNESEKEKLRRRKLWHTFDGKKLCDVVKWFLDDPAQNIVIDPFPSSPTIGYWLIDAAIGLDVRLENDKFKNLCNWVSSEFRHQISLVASSHSTQDPVALVMSACMCQRLRRSCDKNKEYSQVLQDILFPTKLELLAAVKLFFGFQNRAGVWEKYFPIFHYPESGPNHCWHFELLEAVIEEFDEVLLDSSVLPKMDLALDWLTKNRLRFLNSEGTEFKGWNSGSDVTAVRKGEPESWTTSVAHIFLARLVEQLIIRIRDAVLQKFGDRVKVFPDDCDKLEPTTESSEPDGNAEASDTDTCDKSGMHRNGCEWHRYQDAEFLLLEECGLTEDTKSVKRLVESELIDPIEESNVQVNPHMELKDRHSAVLFGPPGTAKTTLCEAIAKRLGWHLVELSPSDFLGGGLERIYEKVNEVFTDLEDLFGVVILFDELDALVRNRDADAGSQRQLDVTETLLTTSMLPKLTKLHKDSRTLFFMATNYIRNFDGAIVRSGRFDLLIQMGPPSSSEKIRCLDIYCRKDKKNAKYDKDFKKAKDFLAKLIEDDNTDKLLGRFTFGEMARLLYSIRSDKKMNLVDAILAFEGKEHKFRHDLVKWAFDRITLSDKSVSFNEENNEIEFLATVETDKRGKELCGYESDARRVSIQ